MKKPKFLRLDWWTTRSAIIMRDEENFSEKRTLYYTPAQVGSLIFLGCFAVFAMGFWLSSMLYSGNATVGKDAEIRSKLVKLNYTVDSLAIALQKREIYTDNLRKTIGGEVSRQEAKMPTDTTKNKTDKYAKSPKDNKTAKDSVNIDALSASDVSLREEMETRNRNTPTTFSSSRGEQLKDMFFFSPVKGIVSNKYDSRTGHLGVDVVSDKDAPLKAIYDGTVIMASWTDETGYVITIQHQSDLLSIYKHCSVLLKKTGDFVRAGEILAIIGNSGELTTGPHLHFELWYKGNPINPEGMIAF